MYALKNPRIEPPVLHHNPELGGLAAQRLTSKRVRVHVQEFIVTEDQLRANTAQQIIDNEKRKLQDQVTAPLENPEEREIYEGFKLPPNMLPASKAKYKATIDARKATEAKRKRERFSSDRIETAEDLAEIVAASPVGQIPAAGADAFVMGRDIQRGDYGMAAISGAAILAPYLSAKALKRIATGGSDAVKAAAQQTKVLESKLKAGTIDEETAKRMGKEVESKLPAVDPPKDVAVDGPKISGSKILKRLSPTEIMKRAGIFRTAKIATPEFKSWFGKSVATQSDSKPVVFYHGTNADFDTFRPSRSGKYGSGIYFTNSPDVAESFKRSNRGKGANPKVIAVHLRMENPVFLHEPIPDAARDRIVKEMTEAGYELSGFQGPKYHKKHGSPGDWGRFNKWRKPEDWSPGNADELLNDIYKDMGFDSMVRGDKSTLAKGNMTYFSVFDPNQVKSVDAKEFSRIKPEYMAGAGLSVPAAGALREERREVE